MWSTFLVQCNVPCVISVPLDTGATVGDSSSKVGGVTRFHREKPQVGFPELSQEEGRNLESGVLYKYKV